MTATIAEILLSKLDDQLQKIESTEEGKFQERGQRATNSIAVDALFTQMSLIVLTLKTDQECWKEVAKFIRQQSGRYKSYSVRGCLDVLGEISKLFVPSA